MELNIDEKLLSLLVSSVKDYAIFMLNPEGTIISWNKGAENIKGYGEEEIIGQHMCIFYTHDDNLQREPQQNLTKALQKGSYETEGWRIRKDGSAFWANVVFTPVYDDNKQLLGFAKVTRDVTERKKAENRKDELNIELEKRVKENTEKIIANELRYRKLIENSHDGITLLDKELNTIYRSSSAERINGWNNDERAEHKIIDLLHPADREVVTNVLVKVLTNPGMPVVLCYRTLHKKGHYIWVECVFTNMLGDAAIKAIVCNFRDVSERKATEELMQKTNDELMAYKFALDESAIVAITDNNGIITHVNSNFSKISKFSKDELIGQSHRIINSGYHDKSFIKNLWETIKRGEIWKGELKNKAKDGTCYWVDTTIVPFLDENGLPYQYMAIRSDITERKQSEETINLLNESLEKKVVERTLELETANKDLESFSYSVSHDLRTPLRAVNGYSAMIKEGFAGMDDAERNRIIGVIADNAVLMGKLIDDLLAFSRLGRQEIKRNFVNMHTLVEVCVRELSGNDTKTCKINIHPIPDCSVDSSMIKQVWMNLIGNAIKYSSKKDCPQIEIGFAPGDDEEIYFVKDNGAGFDMKYSSKLFNVFQRLHRKDEFEGTGIGLAFTKRIIDRHHGRIWVEAAPNEGATFYFSLPKNLQFN